MSKTKHNVSFGLMALAVFVAILLIVISFRCGRNSSGGVTIKRDTSVKFYPYYVRDTYYSEPKIIYQKAAAISVPSDCEGLRLSYTDLATNHYTLKALRDTVRSGKSYVVIEDSLQQNTILNRSVMFNLYHEDKETVINNTITKHDGRQVYLVTGMGASFDKAIKSMNGQLGLAYKDRADRVYTVTYGMNTEGMHNVQLSKSWKISFKRK